MKILKKRRLKYQLYFSDAEIELLELYRECLENSDVPDIEGLLAYLFQNQVDFAMQVLKGEIPDAIKGPDYQEPFLKRN